MGSHRCHPSLVLLPLPVNVEVAETRYLRPRRGQHAAHDVVEEELRVTVDVERPLVLGCFPKHPAVAVSGCRRGVEEPRPPALAYIEEILRAAVIRLQHVAAVVLHRVGACPFVEYRIDMRELAQREAIVELAPIEVIADLRTEEVTEFRAVGEVIDGDHLIDADGVQSMHQIAAYHPGGTRHDHSQPNSSS